MSKQEKLPSFLTDNGWCYVQTVNRTVTCGKTKVKIPPGTICKMQTLTLISFFCMDSHFGNFVCIWEKPGSFSYRCILQYDDLDIEANPDLLKFLNEKRAKIDEAVKKDKAEAQLDSEPQTLIVQPLETVMANYFKTIVGKYVVAVIEPKPKDTFEMGVLSVLSDGNPSEKVNCHEPMAFDTFEAVDGVAGKIKPDPGCQIAILKVEKAVV